MKTSRLLFLCAIFALTCTGCDLFGGSDGGGGGGGGDDSDRAVAYVAPRPHA